MVRGRICKLLNFLIVSQTPLLPSSFKILAKSATTSILTSCRFCSQNSLDTSINFERAKDALARSSGSGYLFGCEQIDVITGQMEANKVEPYMISFSQTFLMNSASASSASAPTTPMSSSSPPVFGVSIAVVLIKMKIHKIPFQPNT